MKLTLKQWRGARGLTQGSMANLCGVHINTYARWEKIPERIEIQHALKLAEVLGVAIDDIIFASDSTNCRADTEENEC